VEVIHRLVAADLDISPLAAEMILETLRTVVHEHYDVRTEEGKMRQRAAVLREALE
jgi:hypothetical protein